MKKLLGWTILVGLVGSIFTALTKLAGIKIVAVAFGLVLGVAGLAVLGVLLVAGQL